MGKDAELRLVVLVVGMHARLSATMLGYDNMTGPVEKERG